MTQRGGTNVLAACEALVLEPEEQTITAVGPKRPSRPIIGSDAKSSSTSKQDKRRLVLFIVFHFIVGFSILLNISLCKYF
jgi:hypothetical protein